MSAAATRTVTQGDLDAFAALSGDDNPIHVDPVAAQRLAFGTTVAHGMLLATLCDGALRRVVDWPWRAAALTFPAPTPAGSEVAIHVAPGDGLAELDVVHSGRISGCQGWAAADTSGLPTGVLDVPTAGEPDGAMSRLVGTVAELERDITADDLAAYAALAGLAPAEVTAVPLPMITALFSCLLGTRLPGPGTNYLKQSVSVDALPAPGRLRARVEVSRVRSERGLVDLATTCVDGDGTLVGAGRALVLAAEVDVAAALAGAERGPETPRRRS